MLSWRALTLNTRLPLYWSTQTMDNTQIFSMRLLRPFLASKLPRPIDRWPYPLLPFECWGLLEKTPPWWDYSFISIFTLTISLLHHGCSGSSSICSMKSFHLYYCLLVDKHQTSHRYHSSNLSPVTLLCEPKGMAFIMHNKIKTYPAHMVTDEISH